MATISKEDVIDAIDDVSEGRLEMLTDFWQSLLEEDGREPKFLVKHSYECAKMLYSAKAYQDTLDWLDAVGLEIEKMEGAEGEGYVAFIEDENIEELRMNALDKSAVEEDEEEDDFPVDDE